MVWKVTLWGFGLLMLSFTLGFGPGLFPVYERGPTHEVSDGAKSVSETSARIVVAPSRAIEPPKKTWRNWVNDIFMLSPVNMAGTGKRHADRSELQKLRSRAEGRAGPGQMQTMQAY